MSRHIRYRPCMRDFYRGRKRQRNLISTDYTVNSQAQRGHFSLLINPKVITALDFTWRLADFQFLRKLLQQMLIFFDNFLPLMISGPYSVRR